MTSLLKRRNAVQPSQDDTPKQVQAERDFYVVDAKDKNIILPASDFMATILNHFNTLSSRNYATKAVKRGRFDFTQPGVKHLDLLGQAYAAIEGCPNTLVVVQLEGKEIVCFFTQQERTVQTNQAVPFTDSHSFIVTASNLVGAHKNFYRADRTKSGHVIMGQTPEECLINCGNDLKLSFNGNNVELIMAHDPNDNATPMFSKFAYEVFPSKELTPMCVGTPNFPPHPFPYQSPNVAVLEVFTFERVRDYQYKFKPVGIVDIPKILDDFDKYYKTLIAKVPAERQCFIFAVIGLGASSLLSTIATTMSGGKVFWNLVTRPHMTAEYREKAKANPQDVVAPIPGRGSVLALCDLEDTSGNPLPYNIYFLDLDFLLEIQNEEDRSAAAVAIIKNCRRPENVQCPGLESYFAAKVPCCGMIFSILAERSLSKSLPNEVLTSIFGSNSYLIENTWANNTIVMGGVDRLSAACAINPSSMQQLPEFHHCQGNLADQYGILSSDKILPIVNIGRSSDFVDQLHPEQVRACIEILKDALQKGCAHIEQDCIKSQPMKN